MASDFSLLVFAICSIIVIRWAVSLSPYSGQGKPPMHGDYEAQRHWMEITLNLPASSWYVNSSKNDLMYWGLDYPPLTAYHSFLCGWIAKKINPDWIALQSSHGYESYEHKLFMRYTVLVADLLIYVPAIICFVYNTMPQTNAEKKVVVAGVMLLYPGLILIDHGHFQYNCVSLGLTIWALVSLHKKYHLLGAAFFVLALNYKQMELYHAFPFFFYLLAQCFRQKTWFKGLGLLVFIAATVISSFAICWVPFLREIESLLQVLRRLFPFTRGLYEDKVANFWCSLSILVKLKQLFAINQLVVLCLFTTLLACVPTSMDLLLRPTIRKFLLSLVNCSLAFFLFSFQVHEKSILIPAISVLALLPWRPFESMWFLAISTVSMYPLLLKDGVILPYFALLLLFCLLVHRVFNVFTVVPTLAKVMFAVSMVSSIILHILYALLKPPDRFPDLYPVLFSLFSCAHFCVFLLYFNYLQFTCESNEDEFYFKEVLKQKSV